MDCRAPAREPLESDDAAAPKQSGGFLVCVGTRLTQCREAHLGVSRAPWVDASLFARRLGVRDGAPRNGQRVRTTLGTGMFAAARGAHRS